MNGEGGKKRERRGEGEGKKSHVKKMNRAEGGCEGREAGLSHRGMMLGNIPIVSRIKQGEEEGGAKHTPLSFEPSFRKKPHAKNDQRGYKPSCNKNGDIKTRDTDKGQITMCGVGLTETHQRAKELSFNNWEKEKVSRWPRTGAGVPGKERGYISLMAGRGEKRINTRP